MKAIDLQNFYESFFKSKIEIDGIFYKEITYENPRSIALFKTFTSIIFFNKKSNRLLNKHLELSMKKVNWTRKNQEELSVSNILIYIDIAVI